MSASRLISIFMYVFFVMACGGESKKVNSSGSGQQGSGSQGSGSQASEQFAVTGSVPARNGTEIQTSDTIIVMFNAPIRENSIYVNSSDSSLDSVRVLDRDNRDAPVSIRVIPSGNQLEISAVGTYRENRNYRLEITSELSSTATTGNSLVAGFVLDFSTREVESEASGDTHQFVICNDNYNETETYQFNIFNHSGEQMQQDVFVSAMTTLDPIENPCPNTFDGYLVEAQAIEVRGLSGHLTAGRNFTAQVRYRVFPNMPVTVVGNRRQVPSTLWSGMSNTVEYRYSP